MSASINVAVVGATGVAGQQFVAALAGHPMFRLCRLASSARTAGKKYRDALRDGSGAMRWYCPEPPPAAALDLIVEDSAQMGADGVDLVFTAVEADVARELEPRLAARVPVVSTASAFRYEPDVPIFLPAVNLDHVGLIDVQRRRRGWRGFITPGPNCTTTGLVLTLMPLYKHFGLRRVVMTSLQACSGAGRASGVLGLDILDNIIPYIPKEEEKVVTETRKLLGTLVSAGDQSYIAPLDLPVSCTCTRVPVLDGHTESVFVETERPVSPEAAREAMESFGGEFLALKLPSAPARLIQVLDDPFRPQPRLDRDCGNGMTTVVGRLRTENALGPHGVKYVLVSHNTRMGAALGAILIAEYLVTRGYVNGA